MGKRIVLLVAVLFSFSTMGGTNTVVTNLGKEIRISLSYGGQPTKESWCNGIEAYYFGEPKIGVGVVYNIYGSRERKQVLDVLEQLRLRERSIGFLYRPFDTEKLVAKFGFKDFDYKKKAYGDFFDPFGLERIDCVVLGRNRITGLWLELSSNKELPVLGKWVKLFGQTGATVARNGRLVETDSVVISNWQVLPEFAGGLAVRLVPFLKVKFGYYQMGLKGKNNFYFTSPVAEEFYFSELKASLEITYSY